MSSKLKVIYNIINYHILRVDCGGIKKIAKIDQPSANLLSPLNMPMTMPIQEEYAIKNELDNDFLSTNIMNSPTRNDYSNINVPILIWKIFIFNRLICSMECTIQI